MPDKERPETPCFCRGGQAARNHKGQPYRRPQSLFFCCRYSATMRVPVLFNIELSMVSLEIALEFAQLEMEK